tara:strand:+ start:185 stop:1009 length:825 start_codon:yes stop_codon:yes gene_type:complete
MQYQGLDAYEKEVYLWHKINKTKYENKPAKFFEKEKNISNIFSISPMKFDHQSDEISDENLSPSRKYATTVKIEIIPNENNSFTGIFKSGARGLARFSVEKNAGTLNKSTGEIALKFLIDTKPSLNMIVRKDFEGKLFDENWIQTKFSTNLSITKKISLINLKKILSLIPQSKNINPLKHLAKFEKSGKKVEYYHSPSHLIFRPSEAVKYLSSKNTNDDFRCELEKVPSNTVLYDVFSQEEPDQEALKVATLVTRSEFISSKFGDEKLFFQPHR